MDSLASLLSIFAVILAAFALLVGLLSAPWQILLLLLLLGLLNIRRVMRQSHLSAADAFQAQSMVQPTDSLTPTPSPPPELTYRGASYQLCDLSTSIDATDASHAEVSGKYRGNIWKSSQPIKEDPT